VFLPVSVSHRALASVPVYRITSRTVGRFQGDTGPSKRSTAWPVSRYPVGTSRPNVDGFGGLIEHGIEPTPPAVRLHQLRAQHVSARMGRWYNAAALPALCSRAMEWVVLIGHSAKGGGAAPRSTV
jgi:hypothetical protein